MAWIKNSKRVAMKSGTRPQPLPPRSNVVRKDDRVGPTKETAKKLAALTGPSGTADQLKDMLHIGTTDPDNPAGMTNEQHEAALRILRTHQAHRRPLDAKTADWQRVAHGHGEQGDRQAEAIALLLRWEKELPHAFYITCGIVLPWIEGTDRMVNDSQRHILKRCLDLWLAMEKGRTLGEDRVPPVDDKPARIRTWVKP